MHNSVARSLSFNPLLVLDLLVVRVSIEEDH